MRSTWANWVFRLSAAKIGASGMLAAAIFLALSPLRTLTTMPGPWQLHDRRARLGPPEHGLTERPVPPNYFGERVAERYDLSAAEMFQPAVVDPVVDFLADLAGGGAVLELGIGTGRIALPLSRRGIRVHGIDLSPEMVAMLRAKPGADAIGVTIGDFATTRVEGTFSVVYLVFNTIMNLTTQDEQVACFQNVARHLSPGGCFVIEVGVPELQRLPPGETARALNVGATRLDFDEYDVVSQGLISHHYFVDNGKFEVFSAPFRYVWPSELDLMARLAGMTVRERWSGWKREPFTSDSTKHVSVWEK
jgi:SAM-dependent methyltransferase